MAQPIPIPRQSSPTPDSVSQSPANEAGASQPAPGTPHLRIVPHFDSPRSLHFDPIDRDVPENTIIKIGRFTDRVLMVNRITFKSKVVSRGHAEIWSEGGQFFIRDTKSSSGTFVNHLRLSPPNQESRAAMLKDGDVIQLGVDYQGGNEEIYRCVKMRLELNRSWQHQLNPFRITTFQNLRTIITPPQNLPVEKGSLPAAASALADCSRIEDCCICLYAIAPFQALFVAPCSHSYHYKCIRPLLQNHPGFLCPLCRTYADLEASVAIEANEVIAKYGTHKDYLAPVQAEDVVVTEDTADNGQDHDVTNTTVARPPVSSAGSDTPVSDSDVAASTSHSPPDAGNRTVVVSITEPLNDTLGQDSQTQTSISASASSRPIPINNKGNSSYLTDEHSIASPSTMVSPAHPSLLTNTLLGILPESVTSTPSGGHGHTRTQSSSLHRNQPPVVSNQSNSERFGIFSHLPSMMLTNTSATEDENLMEAEALSSSSPPPSSVISDRRASTSGLVGKLKMISIFDKKRPGPSSPVSTSPVQPNVPRVTSERRTASKDSPTREAREKDDQSVVASPSSAISYMTSRDEESSSSSSDDKPAELEDEEVAGNSHIKREAKSNKGKAVHIGQIV